MFSLPFEVLNYTLAQSLYLAQQVMGMGTSIGKQAVSPLSGLAQVPAMSQLVVPIQAALAALGAGLPTQNAPAAAASHPVLPPPPPPGPVIATPIGSSAPSEPPGWGPMP